MLPLSLLADIVANDSLTRLAELPRRPGGAQVSAFIAGSTGLDALVTIDRARDRRAGSVALRSTTIAYSFDRGVIVRFANEIAIGGGTDGSATFEGALAASLTGGYRFSITPNQGPFVRAGFLGLVAGDDLLYRSALVLPDAHVGYQYMVSRRVVAEAAYTAGLVLTGRSDAPNDAHDLDLALATGALVALHADPVSLTARWTHMIPTSASSSVDWIEGALCAEPGRTLAICVHALCDRTDTTTITQLGITIGVQQKQRLHRAGLY